MTEKLYYLDSHLFRFEAELKSCIAMEGKSGIFAVTLDRTAFFPEGGGQLADTGRIGNAGVLDVHEKNGEILHYTDTDLTELIGQRLICEIDSEQRLRRMQNHSGEHIVSGLVHRQFGFDNVGFHMGPDCMTIDFSGELTWEQLEEIEQKANETVRSNIEIRTWFPPQEELKSLAYRSKLELTENVRIVEIDGIDRCACCAPHVSRTGEIGMIKLLGCERHRGGVRVELVCGMDALDNFRLRQNSVTAISNLLSVKRNEVAGGVSRLLEEKDRLKAVCASLEQKLVSFQAEQTEETDGNIVLFSTLSEAAGRELVNRLTKKCTGAAAVFFDEKNGQYRYVIGSRTADLRAASRMINTAISGRGGGKPEMIMGSCTAEKCVIEAFFRENSIGG